MSKRYQGGVLGVGFNPLRAPNAPTIGTATGGGCGCASITFTAPACVGGSAVTQYTAQSNPGGFAGVASGSPITVTGLTPGQSYTFGIFALNSYGPSPSSAFSNSITAVNDGTLAIFALGASPLNANRDKYIFAGCINGSATAATAGSYRGAAAGNSTRGIFALGSKNTGPTVDRDKYTYVGDVVSAATAATATACQPTAATGNSTVGIFAVNQARNKYTYSNDAVTAGGAATSFSSWGTATGNSTVGIFALGFSSCALSSLRNKYTYSGDTVASATSATAASAAGFSAGNSTVGIFSLGLTSLYVGSSTRNKYTYSGDVNAAGTAASRGGYQGAAAGNSVIGIFSTGQACGCFTANSQIRNKYTYSNCSNVVATSASRTTTGGSAASNGIAGVTK